MRYTREFYEDIYDRITIDKCRWHEKQWKEDLEKIKGKSKKADEHRRAHTVVHRLFVWQITGTRYQEREQWIKNCLDENNAKEDTLESAYAPDVNCLKCHLPMEEDTRMYDSGDEILFMYNCPSECNKSRRAFYESGKEYVVDKTCPQCKQADLESTYKKKGKIITSTDTCPSCEYKNVMTFGDEKEEKPDPDFEKDRKRFCLDDERGERFIREYRNFLDCAEFMKEMKEKEKEKHIYDAVDNLQKLSIHELKARLDALLSEHQFSDLIFAQPDMQGDVQVTFTAYNTSDERSDNESKLELQKILKKDLLDTNWRLMSDGVIARMGVVTGRLRGYDNEKDLVDLERRKQTK